MQGIERMTLRLLLQRQSVLTDLQPSTGEAIALGILAAVSPCLFIPPSTF